MVRARCRKIIISTNLPHLDDLDETLIRPGRCFARLWLRSLALTEAEALLLKRLGADADALARAKDLLPSGQAEYTLADVCSALRQAQ